MKIFEFILPKEEKMERDSIGMDREYLHSFCLGYWAKFITVYFQQVTKLLVKFIDTSYIHDKSFFIYILPTHFMKKV